MVRTQERQEDPVVGLQRVIVVVTAHPVEPILPQVNR